MLPAILNWFMDYKQLSSVMSTNFFVRLGALVFGVNLRQHPPSELLCGIDQPVAEDTVEWEAWEPTDKMHGVV